MHTPQVKPANPTRDYGNFGDAFDAEVDRNHQQMYSYQQQHPGTAPGGSRSPYRPYSSPQQQQQRKAVQPHHQRLQRHHIQQQQHQDSASPYRDPYGGAVGSGHVEPVFRSSPQQRQEQVRRHQQLQEQRDHDDYYFHRQEQQQQPPYDPYPQQQQYDNFPQPQQQQQQGGFRPVARAPAHKRFARQQQQQQQHRDYLEAQYGGGQYEAHSGDYDQDPRFVMPQHQHQHHQQQRNDYNYPDESAPGIHRKRHHTGSPHQRQQQQQQQQQPQYYDHGEEQGDQDVGGGGIHHKRSNSRFYNNNNNYEDDDVDNYYNRPPPQQQQQQQQQGHGGSIHHKRQHVASPLQPRRHQQEEEQEDQSEEEGGGEEGDYQGVVHKSQQQQEEDEETQRQQRAASTAAANFVDASPPLKELIKAINRRDYDFLMRLLYPDANNNNNKPSAAKKKKKPQQQPDSSTTTDEDDGDQQQQQQQQKQQDAAFDRSKPNTSLVQEASRPILQLEGRSVLHHAIYKQDVKSVNELVKAGVLVGSPMDVTIQGRMRTPVQVAIDTFPDVVPILLSKGKGKNLRKISGKTGNTLLHDVVLAGVREKHPGGVGGGANWSKKKLTKTMLLRDLIQNHSINPHATNLEGYTALDLARRHYHSLGSEAEEVVQLLSDPPKPNSMFADVNNRGFTEVFRNPYLRVIALVFLIALHVMQYLVFDVEGTRARTNGVTVTATGDCQTINRTYSYELANQRFASPFYSDNNTACIFLDGSMDTVHEILTTHARVAEYTIVRGSQLAHFPYVFDAVNLVIASWPNSNSKLLAAKLGCILMGAIVGILFFLFPLHWFLRRVLKLQVFGSDGLYLQQLRDKTEDWYAKNRRRGHQTHSDGDDDDDDNNTKVLSITAGKTNVIVAEYNAQCVLAYKEAVRDGAIVEASSSSSLLGSSSPLGGGTRVVDESKVEGFRSVGGHRMVDPMLIQRSRWRGSFFLGVHGLFCGVFCAGLFYNHVVVDKFHFGGLTVEENRAHAVTFQMKDDIGLTETEVTRLFFCVTLVADVYLLLLVLDTILCRLASGVFIPFGSFRKHFGAGFQRAWAKKGLRYVVFWIVFIATIAATAICVRLDYWGDIGGTKGVIAFEHTTQPIAINGMAMLFLMVVMLQSFSMPTLDTYDSAEKFPGLPLPVNVHWVLWFVCSSLLVLDVRMCIRLIEDWILENTLPQSITDPSTKLRGFRYSGSERGGSTTQFCFALLPAAITAVVAIITLITNILPIAVCIGSASGKKTQYEETCFKDGGNERAAAAAAAVAATGSTASVAGIASPHEAAGGGSYGEPNAAGGSGNMRNRIAAANSTSGSGYNKSGLKNSSLRNGRNGIGNNNNKFCDVWSCAYNDDVIRLCSHLDNDPTLLNAKGGLGIQIDHQTHTAGLCSRMDPRCSAAPLHYAILGHANGAVSALVSRGANTRVRTSSGMYAPKELAEMCHMELDIGDLNSAGGGGGGN